jgi:hypothetical protein
LGQKVRTGFEEDGIAIRENTEKHEGDLKPWINVIGADGLQINAETQIAKIMANL